MSVTVTTPVVAALPALLFGVNVKLALDPTTNVLVDVLLICRSGEKIISAVTVRDALAAVPLVATGPLAVGAAVVLVTVPAVLEVTVTPT